MALNGTERGADMRGIIEEYGLRNNRHCRPYPSGAAPWAVYRARDAWRLPALHRYLAEFDFRYNHRINLGVNDAMRAEATSKGVVGKRLTYRTPY
jgi:hypothetical protein